MSGTPAHTLIVGGGLAGLAAATALAQRGLRVTILESRPRLGGRASSFLDKTTGTPIDNCQHVSLGCCTNFQHFCTCIGISDLLRTEESLFFIGRDNRVNRLAEGSWPAPLHFLSAFGALSYLSFKDRWGIARAMRNLARNTSEADNGLTFADWLAAQHQTRGAIDRFWTPVLVSALSETLDRIDLQNARKVFVDGFLANRQGWRVRIPTVPLDELYGPPLLRWLDRHGATIRMQAKVQQVLTEGNRASGVALAGGQMLSCDHLILAVPHWLVLDLLPESYRQHPQLAPIGRLESAPISSVHLWYDRPILFPADGALRDLADKSRKELPHAVLIERLSQWVFNRNTVQAARDSAADGQFNYQVVISASRDVVAAASQETLANVTVELAEVFPAARNARLLHSRVVTEHRAVFSATPGSEKLRPKQQSPIENLQLAGDWTRTGWPATMEGAVRSGYLAAENVLRHLGRAEPLVQPNLPVSLLSRLLLGIRS